MKMIIYLALFLILLAPVALDIGLFNQHLPAIAMYIIGYIMLVCSFWMRLKRIVKEHVALCRYIVLTSILLMWGLFLCENMEQYAVCIEHLCLLFMPIWIVLMRQLKNRAYLRFIIWCVFILGLFKYFGKYDSGMYNYGGYTAILYLYILFIPYFSIKNRFFIILFWIMSFVYDITDRTHMIMMIGCLSIAICQYFIYISLSNRVWKYIHGLLFILPFLLVGSLILGNFNVFSISESQLLEGLQGEEQLNVDTRSWLYKEVISSQGGFLTWFIGKSFIGSYISSFEVDTHVIYHRMRCEVGILEILIRGGLLYLAIIAYLYYKVSKQALCESRNKLCKSIGLFVLLYWNMFFVELQMNSCLWNVALWLAFGIILNPNIRNMTDSQVKFHFYNFIEK